MTISGLWDALVKSLVTIVLSALVSGGVAAYAMRPSRNVVFVPRFVSPQVVCKVDAGAVARVASGAGVGAESRPLGYREVVAALASHKAEKVLESELTTDVRAMLQSDKLINCEISGHNAQAQILIRVDTVAMFKQSEKYAIERLCSITFEDRYTLPALVSLYDENVVLSDEASIEVFKSRSPLVVEPYKPLVIQYNPVLAGKIKGVSGDELAQLVKRMKNGGSKYQLGIVCQGVGTTGRIGVGQDASFTIHDGELTAGL